MELPDGQSLERTRTCPTVSAAPAWPRTTA